jgi:hypothetical protein
MGSKVMSVLKHGWAWILECTCACDHLRLLSFSGLNRESVAFIDVLKLIVYSCNLPLVFIMLVFECCTRSPESMFIEQIGQLAVCILLSGTRIVFKPVTSLNHFITSAFHAQITLTILRVCLRALLAAGR